MMIRTSFIFVILFILFSCAQLVSLAQYIPHVSEIEKLTKYQEITSPMKVNVMKHMNFPGSEIVIEDVLPKGEEYDRYTVSYLSEQRKIYGIMTIPNEYDPNHKYPTILLAHGYMPEREYDGEMMYRDFVNVLSKNGYITFIPDLRGHGQSEGVAEGAYFSPGYTIDFLNAFSSLSRMDMVHGQKIGVWGHSMGGHIIMRSLVVEKRIKSAVIWSGVVGDYPDLLFHWNNKKDLYSQSDLLHKYGAIYENPLFWAEISPFKYLHSVTSPIQLHHGKKDIVVPYEFSQRFDDKLKKLNKVSELYLYPEEDHDISGNSRGVVLQRTLQFFNTSLQ